MVLAHLILYTVMHTVYVQAKETKVTDCSRGGDQENI